MSAHQADINRILAHRHDNGADYWATPDGRIYVGNPFSTLSCLLMLHELGVAPEHEAVSGALELVLEACRDDGPIRLGPKTPMYPCYTAEGARVLCRHGLAGDERVRRTLAYFLESAHEAGGWRCSFTRFGRGPETELGNPGATLYVLDALRFIEHREEEAVLDEAVDSLLEHWTTRVPTGPCHWGIGTQFLRVEFPFLRYNLFYWVYVLSHYRRARADERFRAALAHLASSVDESGALVVEHSHRGLKDLDFCRKGEPSEPATRRYAEILERMAA